MSANEWRDEREWPLECLSKYDRNLNTGAPLGVTTEMAVAEQRIYHDEEHP